MLTFAGKTKAIQETTPTPANRTLPARDHLGHIREGDSIVDLKRTPGNETLPRPLQANIGDAGGNPTTEIARFGHDFSRIPVFPRQQSGSRQAFRSSGELVGGSRRERQGWLPATGDGNSAGPTAPRSSGSASPSAPAPKLKKTTVSPVSKIDNGGFNWGIQWSIDNATGSTNGWIVQHVRLQQNVEAWHPPLLPGATLPIVPGQGAYGGLSESWYPLWEAWQVRGGSVFVGGSTSPHNSDTYAQDAVGPDTKGKTEVVGRADFYPNLTLPRGFTVKNAAPAWSLPATNTDPSLTGGSGALDHNLTATWDGVSGTGATTATPA